MVHTAAWLPAGLLCLERLRERVDARNVALAGAALGLAALAGHPQVLAFALLIALPYALVFGPRGAATRPYFAALALAGALGVALAAVLVVPLAELLPRTYRGELEARDFFGYALPAREIARVWFPFLYGAPGETFPGRWPPAATMGYVGFASLLLAAGAVRRFRADGRVRFFVVVAAAALLLALGGATPLGELLYRTPVLGLFRAPGRHLFEYSFAVSVLAGLGVAAARREGAGAVAAAASGALALLLALATWTRPDDPGGAHDFLLRAGVLGSLVAWGAAVVAWLRFARGGRLGVALLLAVAALDLGAWSALQPWRRDPPTAATFAAPATAVAIAPRLAETGQRVTPLPGAAGAPETLPPNRSRQWGVPSTGGYNPLRLERYSELLDLGRRSRVSPETVRRPLPLDLLAVRYLTAERGQERLFGLEGSAEWKPVERDDAVGVWERTAPLPRAWLVPRTERRAARDILASIRSGRLAGGGRFDPRRVALVEEEVEALPDGPLAASAVATPTRIEPRRIDVRASSDRAAFLVLSDVHYPGWEVLCDGEPSRLVRCDYALMGTVVPAGEHEISFRFRPASLVAGGAVSVLALVALLGALLVRTTSRAGTGSGPRREPSSP